MVAGAQKTVARLRLTVTMGQLASKAAASLLARSSPAGNSSNAAAAAAAGAARDAAQQKFLRSRAPDPQTEKDEYPELPPELVKFIQDVGPLKKVETTNKAKRREKGAPKWVEEAAAQDEHQEDGRKIVSMPLARGIDGYETKRTTNFSTRVEDTTVDPTDFHIGDVVDLYSTLKQKQEEHQSQSTVDAIYDELTLQNDKSNWNPDDVVQQKALLLNTLQYLDIPVLMKDKSDDGFVGISPKEVQKFEESMETVRVPPQSAKLVLEDLFDQEGLKRAPDEAA